MKRVKYVYRCLLKDMASVAPTYLINGDTAFFSCLGEHVLLIVVNRFGIVEISVMNPCMCQHRRSVHEAETVCDHHKRAPNPD
jgi:hypothetical protein